MKLKIAKIDRINRHSEAKNKDYVSVIITDDKNVKYSGFGNKINEKWNVGDEVEVDVKVNGKYNNFELPSRKINADDLQKQLNIKFKEIDERLKHLENLAYNIATPKSPVEGHKNEEDTSLLF